MVCSQPAVLPPVMADNSVKITVIRVKEGARENETNVTVVDKTWTITQLRAALVTDGIFQEGDKFLSGKVATTKSYEDKFTWQEIAQVSPSLC